MSDPSDRVSRAARVRLLALDVDGVLTDNAVYLGQVNGQRVEFKRFDIQDGLGLVLLRGSGVAVALVSARPSEATLLRASELRIADVIQVEDGRKVPALERLLQERDLGWEEVAFLGDDLADLPVLRRVGFPAAVANAVRLVRDQAAWITTAPGGAGAVRELVEFLLEARGEYAAAVERYLGEDG